MQALLSSHTGAGKVWHCPVVELQEDGLHTSPAHWVAVNSQEACPLVATHLPEEQGFPLLQAKSERAQSPESASQE